MVTINWLFDGKQLHEDCSEMTMLCPWKKVRAYRLGKTWGWVKIVNIIFLLNYYLQHITKQKIQRETLFNIGKFASQYNATLHRLIKTTLKLAQSLNKIKPTLFTEFQTQCFHVCCSPRDGSGIIVGVHQSPMSTFSSDGILQRPAHPNEMQGWTQVAGPETEASTRLSHLK